MNRPWVVMIRPTLAGGEAEIVAHQVENRGDDAPRHDRQGGGRQDHRQGGNADSFHVVVLARERAGCEVEADIGFPARMSAIAAGRGLGLVLFQAPGTGLRSSQSMKKAGMSVRLEAESTWSCAAMINLIGGKPCGAGPDVGGRPWRGDTA